MARCVDCAWLPWKPGADLSLLPTMNCYPGSPRRRWTEDGVRIEHDCPHFKPRAEATAKLVGPGVAVTLEPEPTPKAKKKKGRR